VHVSRCGLGQNEEEGRWFLPLLHTIGRAVATVGNSGGLPSRVSHQGALPMADLFRERVKRDCRDVVKLLNVLVELEAQWVGSTMVKHSGSVAGVGKSEEGHQGAYLYGKGVMLVWGTTPKIISNGIKDQSLVSCRFIANCF
jgi:hypothetical protein